MGNKTALVSGGTSGIGLEFCRLLASDGYDLVVVARKKDDLEQAAKELRLLGVSVLTIQKDLSLPGAPQEVFGQLKAPIDILVNNAGFGLFGEFAKTDLGRELEMMQLNMLSLTAMTKLFLPGMLARKSGKILNVASTAAFQPGPLMAVYYASKAYVLHFSEAISNELRGTGVTVTALCPGPTKTGFQSRAKMDGSKLFRNKIGDAAKVAKAGYDGMMKGKAVVIPGFRNRLLAFSVRLVPRSFAAASARSFQEKEAG